jgi:hypothetical protein
MNFRSQSITATQSGDRLPAGQSRRDTGSGQPEATSAKLSGGRQGQGSVNQNLASGRIRQKANGRRSRAGPFQPGHATRLSKDASGAKFLDSSFSFLLTCLTGGDMLFPITGRGWRTSVHGARMFNRDEGG